MKVSCDIIRDVLPLYAEDMVSNATRDMVDEHLCGCDDCMKELGALKKAAKVPVEIDTGGLKKVGLSIRRRRWLAVLAAVVTLMTMALTVYAYLLTPIVLTSEEAIEGVEVLEDGTVRVDYARGILGTGTMTDGVVDVNQCETDRWTWWKARQLDKKLASMSREEVESYIRNLYQLTEVTQRDWNRFFSIQTQYNAYLDEEGKTVFTNISSEDTLWYGEPDGSFTWVYGDGPKPEESLLERSSCGYSILAILCAGLAAVLWLLAEKGNGRFSELCRSGMVLAVCAGFSTVLVTGVLLGTDVLISMNTGHRWPQLILLETVFLTASILLWRRLVLLNRKDRGM